MENTRSAQSPFTMAITAYALALLNVNSQAALSTFSALKKEEYVIGILNSLGVVCCFSIF